MILRLLNRVVRFLGTKEIVVLFTFKAHTARGRLRDRHQQLLRSKLAQLKAEQFGKKEDSPTAYAGRRKEDSPAALRRESPAPRQVERSTESPKPGTSAENQVPFYQ